jgi:O-antigen/teichoic acid export membrane protein
MMILLAVFVLVPSFFVGKATSFLKSSITTPEITQRMILLLMPTIMIQGVTDTIKCLMINMGNLAINSIYYGITTVFGLIMVYVSIGIFKMGLYGIALSALAAQILLLILLVVRMKTKVLPDLDEQEKINHEAELVESDIKLLGLMWQSIKFTVQTLPRQLSNQSITLLVIAYLGHTE